MTDWLPGTPQIDEPSPCWKMNTTIPYAAASENRFSTTAFAARTIERNARVSRMSVRIITTAMAYGRNPDVTDPLPITSMSGWAPTGARQSTSPSCAPG